MDNTATVAQYMLFLQLFAAILIREGILEKVMPPEAMSAMLVFSNVFVVVREAIAKYTSKLLKLVEDTFSMPPEARTILEDKCEESIKTHSHHHHNQKLTIEQSETAMGAINDLHEKKLGFVPQRDRDMVEKLLLKKLAPQGIKTTFTLEEDYAFEGLTAEATAKPTARERTITDEEGSKETAENSNDQLVVAVVSLSGALCI